MLKGLFLLTQEWATNKVKSFLVTTLCGERVTLERALLIMLGFLWTMLLMFFLLTFILTIVVGQLKKVLSGLGFEPMFRNAVYWTNKKHWDWALSPNKREVASFLKENLLPIEQSGRLNFISNSGGQFSFASELGFDVFYADGHTEKQMIPIITYKGQKIAFAADLIPTAGHIPLPYVMGYDVRPLTTLKRKGALFLDYAVENNVLLFLEHDSVNEILSLKNTEKGVRINEFLKCKDVF